MAQTGVTTPDPSVPIEQSGVRMFDPNAVTAAVAKGQGQQITRSIVASTTQTAVASSATAQMNPGLNNILTCANASDGVALPDAVAGSLVHFFNAGAQTCKVFGKAGTSDTINGTAGATGVTGPGANKMGIAMCTFNGLWRLGITA